MLDSDCRLMRPSSLRRALRDNAINGRPHCAPAQDTFAMKRLLPPSLAFFAAHLLFIGATIALGAFN